MKIRILSGIVAAILLFAIMLSGTAVFAAALFVFALFGIHEFYDAMEKAGNRPVRIPGYLSCLLFLLPAAEAAGLLKGIRESAGSGFLMDIALLAAFIALLVLMLLPVFKKNVYRHSDIALTILGILYVPFLFMFIMMTRELDYGKYLVWLIFIGAWVTDIFAYFTGTFFGKHKLMPAISPSKTVEGAVGGLLACIVISVLYGYLIRTLAGVVILPLYCYAVIALISGITSQLSDLSASSVKRYAGIKDFGSIMPGHGGVLDRLDSLLFVAPAVYFMLGIICGAG